MQAPNKIQTVSELSRLLRHTVEMAVRPCWVQGELSNFVRAASGHCYFIVKDSNAQIRCALFRGTCDVKKIDLRDGLVVELLVRPTVYAARGDLQLIVEDIRLGGEGELFKAFIELKLKLKKEGLFENRSKQKIPSFPQTVGIVTSQKGAAIRDVIAVLRKRMPAIRLIVFPTPVQGKDSSEKITMALKTAARMGNLDVILVCRGGGSLEDLWGFNSEDLARAAFNCSTPIVSGVGHETDFTIIDFVADQRAPTPTGAAVLVSPDRLDLSDELAMINKSFKREFKALINREVQRLDYISRRLVAPADKVLRQSERIQGIQHRLTSAFREAILAAENMLHIQAISLRAKRSFFVSRKTELEVFHRELIAQSQQAFYENGRTLSVLENRLSHFDVETVLSRGFSIIENSDGELVSGSSQISPGDDISIKFATGSAEASVIKVDKKSKI